MSIQNFCKKKPCLIQFGKKKNPLKVMLHHWVNYQNDLLLCLSLKDKKTNLNPRVLVICRRDSKTKPKITETISPPYAHSSKNQINITS